MLLLVLAIVVLAIVSQVVAVRPWTGGRQAERGARSGGSPETDPEILACPFFANDEFVVRCPEGRYTMLYDTAYRQAAWVAYLLTRRDVSGKGVKRSGVFKSDPEVIARGWPSAADRDYTGSDTCCRRPTGTIPRRRTGLRSVCRTFRRSGRD